MAAQQLPAQLVINFFIKNTFINIVDIGAHDDGSDEANARRCRSAPPTMRTRSTSTPNTPPEEDADVTENEELVHPIETSSEEASGQRPVDDSVYEAASEGDGEESTCVEHITGSTSMRESDQEAAPPRKIRRSVLIKQQERAEEQFLDEEISRVREEKWGMLTKGLLEFCAQKYSLSTLRIETLVPCLQFVINKLAFMHVVRFVGFSPSMVDALKHQGFLWEKRETTEIWATRVDAQKNEQIRLLLPAAKRFQQAFVDRQVLIQKTWVGGGRHK